VAEFRDKDIYYLPEIISISSTENIKLDKQVVYKLAYNLMGKEHIQMKFICDQDWDEMQHTRNGRHCEMCKQEVRDFTNTSISKIRELKKNNEKLCGRFTAEQVDPLMITELDIKGIRKVVSIAATFLLVASKSANSQSTQQVKTEQVESNEVNNDSAETRSMDSEGSRIDKASHTRKVTLLTTRKRYYFLSWRFPFVHTRTRHVFMGKF
jgi:hypothetical protein